MYLDVVDLKGFYAGRLGQIAARNLGQRLRRHWDSVSGERVLGIGFTGPYLTLLPEAERRLSFMPASQGVVSWPSEGRNAAALVRDDALPLEGGSVDRVLLVHCLEHAESGEEFLREIWRVLAPGGRLLIVVPNRAGMWARTERTPFGHGQPYSRAQLSRLLRDTMFTPTLWAAALAMPPTNSRVLLRGGAHWERIGRRFWPGFSGVLIVEAAKLVQQRIERRPRQRVPRRVLSPALAPPAGLRPRTLA